MSKFFVLLASLLLIVAFTPSTTKADPVVITGGSLTVIGFGGPVYTLSGNSFSATGIGQQVGLLPLRACNPCASGSVISANASFAGASVGGQQTFGFSFVGPPITIPFSLTDLTITSPFEFSGNLTGCLQIFCGPTLPTFSLVGNGTAVINLRFTGLDSAGTPTFSFQNGNITYLFQSVPEPTSLLLLGGGLLALGARLRRKSRPPQ